MIKKERFTTNHASFPQGFRKEFSGHDVLHIACVAGGLRFWGRKEKCAEAEDLRFDNSWGLKISIFLVLSTKCVLFALLYVPLQTN